MAGNSERKRMLAYEGAVIHPLNASFCYHAAEKHQSTCRKSFLPIPQSLPNTSRIMLFEPMREGPSRVLRSDEGRAPPKSPFLPPQPKSRPSRCPMLNKPRRTYRSFLLLSQLPRRVSLPLMAPSYH